MKVAFIPPIDYCIGKLSMKSEFYFRRNKHGKVFVQHCPRRLSEKQKAWNKQFARLYAGKHRHHSPQSQRILRIQTLPKKQIRGIMQGKQSVQQYLERNSTQTAMPTIPSTATPTITMTKHIVAQPVIIPPTETNAHEHLGQHSRHHIMDNLQTTQIYTHMSITSIHAPPLCAYSTPVVYRETTKQRCFPSSWHQSSAGDADASSAVIWSAKVWRRRVSRRQKSDFRLIFFHFSCRLRHRIPLVPTAG